MEIFTCISEVRKLSPLSDEQSCLIKGDRKYHLECQIFKIVKPLPDTENKIKAYWSKVLGILVQNVYVYLVVFKTNEWMKDHVISPMNYSVTSKDWK